MLPPCNILPTLHIWSRHVTAYGRLSNGRGPIIAEGVYAPRIWSPFCAQLHVATRTRFRGSGQGRRLSEHWVTLGRNERSHLSGLQ